MNKKHLLLVTTVIGVFVLFGAIFIRAQGNIFNDLVISSGENFKVFDVSKDNSPEYRYEIYNKNGKTVDTEIISRIEPDIAYITKNLLEIQVAAGTGLTLTHYYDIEKDLFSETFSSPVMVDNGKLVYMDLSDNTLKLIARDIFDKSKLYKEFKLDFSPVANPADALQEAKIVNDNTLKITYLTGDGFEEKTELLPLK